MHAPAWQVSVCVQALLSLHAVPSGATGFEQTPVTGLHDPGVWHGSEAVQTTGLTPMHAPAWQVSVCVQALLSLHVVPSGATGFVQVPVPGSHVPAVWQPSEAVQ